MDQASSALGAGNLFPGIVTETTGSVMGIGVTAGLRPRPGGAPALPAARSARLDPVPPLRPDRGKRIQVVDGFCQDTARGGTGGGIRADERPGRRSFPAPTGSSSCLPLAGAGQPENDPDARGVFYGLTLLHGKGHCARAERAVKWRSTGAW